jgi:hypothetical protein
VNIDALAASLAAYALIGLPSIAARIKASAWRLERRARRHPRCEN